MTKQMKEIEIIKKENLYIKSEIDSLSDLLWSMCARIIYPAGKKLVE